MVLGRLRADEEPATQLGVREALAEQAQHLLLALREDVDASRARPALRAERPEEGRGVGGGAIGAERLELAMRAAGDVDRELRLGRRQGARQLEARAGGVERKADAAVELRGATEGRGRVALAAGCGDAAPRDVGRGLGPSARDGDRRKRGRGVCRRRGVPERHPGLDEQRQDRDAHEAVAAELVEPLLEHGRSGRGLPACEAERSRRLDRLRRAVEAAQELVGLLEAPLEDADLREPRGRVRAP